MTGHGVAQGTTRVARVLGAMTLGLAMVGVAAAPASADAASPAETVPDCTSAQIAMTVPAGEGGAGLGHRSTVIWFTNTSAATCQITGYSSVDLFDADGTAIAHARQTMSGYMGGALGLTTPPVVGIAPGETASAMIEGLAWNEDGFACPKTPTLVITGPQGGSAQSFTWQSPGCGNLQIHPVVPGSNGWLDLG